MDPAEEEAVEVEAVAAPAAEEEEAGAVELAGAVAEVVAAEAEARH